METAHLSATRIKEQFLIPGTSDRPIPFGPGASDIDALPDLKYDPGPFFHAVIDAFQKPVKELPLFLHVFFLVKMPPLLSPMNQKPLLFGRHLLETFQGPAQMEPLIRPARYDECRHLYL